MNARDCAALADALAFSLALILDPSLSEVMQPAPTAAPPQPEPQLRVERDRRARRRQAPHGRLGVAGGIDYGALPGIAGNVAVDLLLGGRHWRFGITGRYGAPRRDTTAELNTAGATFQLGAAGLLGCGVLPLKAIEIPGCGGLEVGVVRADGFGLDPNRTVHRVWLAGTLGSGIDVRLSRSWLSFVRIEAVFPALRPSFSPDMGKTFHTVGPAGLRALLGLAVRFGGDPRGS